MFTRLLPPLVASARRSLCASRNPLHYRYNELLKTTRRSLATPPPHINVSSLSTERYHRLSDETMEILFEELENILDNFGNPSYEVEYSSGVLTLRLGEHGTYVINKQPPNKQIWLSSPVSGPKRYDYSESDGHWRYSRNNESLSELLNEELSKTLETPVELDLRSKEN
ncbi:Mitochondrial matrix iron chaperone [Stygiomarasmius scandens]|uniref:ferroxidase n=1 Tax=Marasmiellus scandens TaxID=2682957 RepID=A0ABR1JLX6_9AGAR